MEKQVGIPLKGNGKGGIAARLAAIRWQVAGLSIGLMVMVSAFPSSVQAQTVSGNETVEASEQTMELMPVRQALPIITTTSKSVRIWERTQSAVREGDIDTYIDRSRVRTRRLVCEYSTRAVLNHGIPAEYENREFGRRKSPSH
jgi:hypothetical protein